MTQAYHSHALVAKNGFDVTSSRIHLPVPVPEVWARGDIPDGRAPTTCSRPLADGLTDSGTPSTSSPRSTGTPANPLKTSYPAKCRCTLKKPPVKPMVFSNSIEQQKLFCLVSHHSKAFLPLVRCNLMLFSFSSARHRRTPLSLAAAKASVDVITRLLCRFGNVWSSRKRRPGKDCVTLTKDYSGVRRHRSSSSRPYR